MAEAKCPRLTNYGNCKRKLARIIRDIESGKIHPTIGGKLIYGLNTMLAFLNSEMNEKLESRLAALEERYQDE